MNISLNWLTDYVDVAMPADELGRLFTFIGLNCEDVTTTSTDVIFDLEVTSNRPDCLGHLGVAHSAVEEHPRQSHVVIVVAVGDEHVVEFGRVMAALQHAQGGVPAGVNENVTVEQETGHLVPGGRDA